MEKSVLGNIEIEEQKEFVLPEGGILIKSSESISVRKITNGFILRKSYDIKWKPSEGDDTQYEYYTKEWYCATNPVSISMPKEKSLAEKLD
jgi:hypothetical protein